MSILIGNSLLLNPTAGGSSAYQISRSLRFNGAADSSNLSKTFSTSGSNLKIRTFACWIKRVKLGTGSQSIFTGYNGSAGASNALYFDANDKLSLENGSGGQLLTTSQVFRDTAAWFHLLVAIDTTQGTASNRVKIYVNGVQVTEFSSSSYIGQNVDTMWCLDNGNNRIGAWWNNSSYSDFYLADVYLIDGQQLDPSSFTTTDLTTGQLIPKAYTGSYGTNGFKLNFSDNSTTAALGTDSSGNGNTWTANNFSVAIGGTASVTMPASNAPPTVDYLVVAGGGGGGYAYGGGGGGGGVRCTVGATGGGGSPETPLSVTAGTTYTVTVGAGGLKNSAVGIRAGNGEDSVFGSIVSTGGGGGGSAEGSGSQTGATGGSAGGSAGADGRQGYDGVITGGTRTASPVQGNNGGNSYAISGNGSAGGGGGGAGAVGGASPTSAPMRGGAGGSGVTVSIAGSATYGGGGGGGSYGSGGSGGAGGSGGGAAGTTTGGTTVNATPNTGGGGGGGGPSGSNGGSGIVIIRYADTYSDLAFISPNLTYSYSNTGGYKIYTFTGSDTTAAGNDSLVDTPTSYGTDTGVGGEVRGNYATLNNLLNTTGSYANGNLERTSSDNTGALGTICPSSGKWYAEFTWTTIGSAAVGVIISTRITSSAADGLTQSWQLGYTSTGKLETAGSQSNVTGFTTSDVIGVAFDSATGAATFYKNGSSIGTATSAAFASVPVGIGACGGGSAGTNTFIANFGQRAFAYPVSGYKALVDTNLPTPTIAKGNTLMDVALYTGNASTNTISGLGFSPDLVWIKSRSDTNWHNFIDTVRGNNKIIYSNATDAEASEATPSLTSFNSGGFTLSGNGSTGVGNVNGNGTTYVAWTWDAGTSTVTNTAGSITASLRANTSSGFSVVSFTGTGSGATVGHGLGIAPAMIIVKNRSSTTDWAVGHTSAGWSVAGNLNNTNSFGASSYFNSTAPTSTVFSVGASSISNGSGNNIIAYCFTPVSGYSSIGSYTGNGSNDGPFVYTGFRPRWILFKSSSYSSADSDWTLWDSARSPYNAVSKYLLANKSNAEGDVAYVDLLSNGFKMRYHDAGPNNASGQTYIYAAFAESPFQYARAR